MPPTYLIAPFRDKEHVKALGGRWDSARRQWYVPDGKDLEPFAAWLPASVSPHAHAVTEEAGNAAPSWETPAERLSLTHSTSAHWPSPSRIDAGEGAGTSQVLSAPTPKGVSLSDLLSGVSQVVTAAFRDAVWVRVDVVDARLKGHVYLELAERSPRGDLVAKCHAMIWSAVAQRILPEFQQSTGVELAAGIKLLVRARPVFKAQYGFSLEIDAIDAQYTLGDLEARKREIRERLQREGLWRLNKELPAPWDHRHVLVIAPEGGAGLGDFQAEAGRLQQHGVCQFFYAYSRFQGEGAADQIRREMLVALENIAANHPWQVDAVVIIRGGGAVNDLAWLNDYELARSICELQIPVFTGIGHERDSTILDEVAHTRFDTPSKVIAGIERTIVQRVRAVQDAFGQIAHEALQSIQLARRVVDHAMSQVQMQARTSVAQAQQHTQRHHTDIRHLARSQVAMAKRDIPALLHQVHTDTRQCLRLAQSDVEHTWRTLTTQAGAELHAARQHTERGLLDVQVGVRQQVGQARSISEALMREITGQGPQRTLDRGFALIRTSMGQAITRATQLDVTTGEIQIEFADGLRTVSGDYRDSPHRPTDNGDSASSRQGLAE